MSLDFDAQHFWDASDNYFPAIGIDWNGVLDQYAGWTGEVPDTDPAPGQWSLNSRSEEAASMYFRIKTFLLGKQGKSTHTRKIKRISWILNHVEWDRVWLQVEYGSAGITNEGEYTDIDEAKAALAAWCEPELRAYLGVE